jgi:hypothetical protein
MTSAGRGISEDAVWMTGENGLEWWEGRTGEAN